MYASDITNNMRSALLAIMTAFGLVLSTNTPPASSKNARGIPWAANTNPVSAALPVICNTNQGKASRLM